MSKNLLGVVWMGRDNNRPTQLTGATGALRVWSEAMKPLKPRPLYNPLAPGYQKVWLDAENGFIATSECPNAIELILPTDQIPTQRSRCSSPGRGSIFQRWLRPYQ